MGSLVNHRLRLQKYLKSYFLYIDRVKLFLQFPRMILIKILKCFRMFSNNYDECDNNITKYNKKNSGMKPLFFYCSFKN